MDQSEIAGTDQAPGIESSRHGLGEWWLAITLGALAVVCFAVLAGVNRGRPAASPPSSDIESQRRARWVVSNEVSPAEHGRQVFQARCARCHGPEGRGDGPDAAALPSPLSDLASASWRTTAVREDVLRSIANETHEKGMPGAAGGISAADQDAVVDHVLALRIEALMTRAGFTPGGGEAAPALPYRDAAGAMHTLEERRGALVLVAFWGTTCVPCMKELPGLERLADRFKGTGLEVLPVCLDEEDPKKASDVAAGPAPGLPVYVDADGSGRINYRVRALPQTALVDREGRMIARSYGARRWELKEVEEVLCACLGVPFPLAPESTAGD